MVDVGEEDLIHEKNAYTDVCGISGQCVDFAEWFDYLFDGEGETEAAVKVVPCDVSKETAANFVAEIE